MFNSESFFRSRFGILFSAIVTTALWGCMLPLIKVGYELCHIESGDKFGQLLFAGIRFTWAGLMIMAYMRIVRGPVAFRPGSSLDLLKISLILIFLQNAALNLGISLSTGIFASLTSGIVSFNQLMIAHFAYAQDKLNRHKWVGIGFGFAGLLLLSFQVGDGQVSLHLGFGELLLFVTTLFAAWGNIIAKNAAVHHPVTYLNAYSLLIGGGLLLLLAGIGGGWSNISLNPLGVVLMLFMSLTAAFTYIVWNNLMKYNPVGKISMYLFLVPVFGVIQSSLYLGESISSFVFVSMVLVSAGILIVNKQRHTPA